MSRDLAPQEEEAAPSALGALVLHHMITLTMAIAVLALGVWGYLNFKSDDFLYTPSETSASTQRYLVASHLQRLMLAARTYQQLHDAPPVSLEALVEERLLLPDDLSYPSPAITYTLAIINGQVRITYALDTSAQRAPGEQEKMPPLE